MKRRIDKGYLTGVLDTVYCMGKLSKDCNNDYIIGNYKIILGDTNIIVKEYCSNKEIINVDYKEIHYIEIKDNDIDVVYDTHFKLKLL